MAKIKWTIDKLQRAALQYRTRTSFYIHNPLAYNAAYKRGISKNIDILHIKEDNWIRDRESCLKEIFVFLQLERD